MGASWDDYLDTPLHVIEWDLELADMQASLQPPE